MLNQLIESKNHRDENVRKNGFLFSTLGILLAVLVSGWTYSLFAKNYGMGTGEFELSSIVAPVALPETAPPPKPEVQPERQSAPSNRPTVIEKIATIEDTRIPPKETKGEVLKSPPLKASDADLYNLGDKNVGRNDSSRTYSENTIGLNGDNNSATSPDVEPEVKVKPTPAPTVKKDEPKKPTGPVSLGVVNGKASYLAKPPYPAVAKPLRIADSVSVQVLIDEQGNVVSATAVSGHPLLRGASVSAARQSKFTPTFLSNVPVKVTGVIVYKFTP